MRLLGVGGTWCAQTGEPETGLGSTPCPHRPGLPGLRKAREGFQQEEEPDTSLTGLYWWLQSRDLHRQNGRQAPHDVRESSLEGLKASSTKGQIQAREGGDSARKGR